MPRPEPFRLQLSDLGIIEGERRINIFVTAAPDALLLSDLLVEKNAMPSLTTTLRNGLKTAIKSYIAAPEELLNRALSERSEKAPRKRRRTAGEVQADASENK